MPYGIIDPAFWDDARIVDRSIPARLLAAFLLTGRQATLVPGLVNLGMGGLSESSRIPRDQLASAMTELLDAEFCEVDQRAHLIRVPRAPRYNRPRNDKVVRAWFHHWKSMPESALKHSHVASLWEAVSVSKAPALAEAWRLTFGSGSGSEDIYTYKVNEPLTTPLTTLTAEVLEYLNQRSGRGFRSVEANLKFIRARMDEGATVADCRAVIDAKVREWKGTEYAKYLRPETLFNATKFASYIGQITGKPKRPMSELMAECWDDPPKAKP